MAAGAKKVGYKECSTGNMAINSRPRDGRPATIQDGFCFQGIRSNVGSAQIDVKISFKGRQPNKESAAKPLCRYVSPATALHTKRNVITLRIPSMKWSRYSVTNA